MVKDMQLVVGACSPPWHVTVICVRRVQRLSPMDPHVIVSYQGSAPQACEVLTYVCSQAVRSVHTNKYLCISIAYMCPPKLFSCIVIMLGRVRMLIPCLFVVRV